MRILAFFLLVLSVFLMGPAQNTTTVRSAIQQLQPRVTDERAERLAEIIVRAGEESDIEPFLIASIIMRESSFQTEVERLEVFGEARGEPGLMQTHGASLRLRPDHCSYSIETAECQIFTGTRWLAFAREQCGGSMWRWVSAYGRRACPSERLAREEHRVALVRDYYMSIGGTSWEE